MITSLYPLSGCFYFPQKLPISSRSSVPAPVHLSDPWLYSLQFVNGSLVLVDQKLHVVSGYSVNDESGSAAFPVVLIVSMKVV